MKLPVAAQVYSVREQAEADFGGTMQQLAEMGYDGVELAGLYGKSAGETIMTPSLWTRPPMAGAPRGRSGRSRTPSIP